MRLLRNKPKPIYKKLSIYPIYKLTKIEQYCKHISHTGKIEV